MNNTITEIREHLLNIYGQLGTGQGLCPADVTRLKRKIFLNVNNKNYETFKRLQGRF